MFPLPNPAGHVSLRVRKEETLGKMAEDESTVRQIVVGETTLVKMAVGKSTFLQLKYCVIGNLELQVTVHTNNLSLWIPKGIKIVKRSQTVTLTEA